MDETARKAVLKPGWTGRTIETNSIRQFVVEAGSGPAVLFCHGWPELWYSWRGQIDALAEAGYRVIVPDMRGYGGTEAPEAIEDYTQLHIVGDMVALLDALDVDKAVIVGHDWGSMVAWNGALFRPDRFHACASLSVPYAPRGDISLIEAVRQAGLDGFYMLHFQEPGRAEGEFAADWDGALSGVYRTISGDMPEGTGWVPVVPPGGTIRDTFDPGMPDPAWMSAEEFRYYLDNFRSTGLRGGLNWYRNLHRNWELTAPWHRAQILVPAAFIAGERDGVLSMPGIGDYVEQHPKTCADFRGQWIIPGAGHWVQQEAKDAVNAHLLEFLKGL